MSSAQNAKLRIFQDQDLLTIDWQDLFDNELGYQLQRRGADGEWQAVNTLGPGDGERMLWMPIIGVSGSYRLVALLDDHVMPLHAGLNETEFPLDLGPSPMTITLDQAEPVTGNVQVSMQNVGPALSVVYQLDNQRIAESSAGGAFTATLPPERLLNGRHTLTALVQKTEGLFIYLNRSLHVNNPSLALLLGVTQSSTIASTLLRMNALATSQAGVASIAFFVNDAPVSVLTAPDETGRYVVTLDRSTLPSGLNAFRAVATDYNGASVSMEQRFTINQWPSLEVSGLFDGMIAANGRLDVQATFGDDTPGATLTILVGQHRLVQTQTSPLRGSYSLDGIAPGRYPVLVRVRDATGKVNVRTYQVIVSSTGLSYELLATDAAELLATDRGALLYRKHSGATVLETATGTETQLPAASASFERYWLVENRIVARGSNGHVYVLDANGQPTDLSASDLYSAFPKVRGPWVTWTQPSSFRLYNVRTGELRSVQLGGSSYASIREYDLDPTPGNERLVVAATIDNVSGIYGHSLTTNTTQLLVSGLAASPRTDGVRMSWRNGTESYSSLLVAPLSNPSASTSLGTGMTWSELDDGLLCWAEFNGVLHVNDGSSTTQLTGYEVLNRNVLEGGRILFHNGDDMRVWSAAGGERVWLDAMAQDAIHSDGVAYFLTGTSGTLYRVTLP
nr:hypothetical protein [uncultured Steroidobacter sp.]